METFPDKKVSDLILEHFGPSRSNVVAIISYGSAQISEDTQNVFGDTQHSIPGKVGRQSDFIVVVDDLHQFHKANMKRNPQDYSWLGKKWWIRSLLEKSLWYNPHVKVQGISGEVKYGIIPEGAFKKDLRNGVGYLSGRLQKPATILYSRDPNKDELEKTIQVNRRKALYTALFLLKGSKFKMSDLLKRILSLSYLGDIRSMVENTSFKVNEIYSERKTAIGSIYDPLIQEATSKGIIIPDDSDPNNEKFRVDESHELQDYLPQKFKKYRKLTARRVRRIIVRANLVSSFKQTWKGLLTAGIRKSRDYVRAKREKDQERKKSN